MITTSLVFYNIFINCATGIVGLLNFWHSYRRYKDVKEVMYFAWFWLLAGLLWLFVGIGAIFYWRGFWQVDYNIFYIVQFFVALNPPVLILYVLYRIFNWKSLTKIILVFYLIAAALYFYFILTNGFIGPVPTFFGAEYTPNDISLWIFKIIYPGIILILYLFFKQIDVWLKTNAEIDKFRAIAVFSLVLYAGAGWFEELGLYQWWHMFLARSLLLLSALIASLSYNYKKLEI